MSGYMSNIGWIPGNDSLPSSSNAKFSLTKINDKEAMTYNTTTDNIESTGYYLRTNINDSTNVGTGSLSLTNEDSENVNQNSTVIGYGASSRGAGSHLVSIGTNSIAENNSVNIGNQAGSYTANNSCYIGYRAGYKQTAGGANNNNVSLGYLSMFNASSGNHDIAIGPRAGFKMESGSNDDIYIGSWAGSGYNGSRNIIMSSNADTNQTVSDSILISSGNSGTITPAQGGICISNGSASKTCNADWLEIGRPGQELLMGNLDGPIKGLRPGEHDVVSLGNSSFTWRNIYSQNIQLQNRGFSRQQNGFGEIWSDLSENPRFSNDAGHYYLQYYYTESLGTCYFRSSGGSKTGTAAYILKKEIETGLCRIYPILTTGTTTWGSSFLSGEIFELYDNGTNTKIALPAAFQPGQVYRDVSVDSQNGMFRTAVGNNSGQDIGIELIQDVSGASEFNFMLSWFTNA